MCFQSWQFVKKTVFEPVSFMLLEAWGLKVLEYQSSPNIDISSKHRNNYAIYGCFPFGIFYILAGFSISMLVYWMYKNKTYKSRQYEATWHVMFDCWKIRMGFIKAPVGYQPASLQQIIHADNFFWAKLAEKVGIEVSPASVDRIIQEIMVGPEFPSFTTSTWSCPPECFLEAFFQCSILVWQRSWQASPRKRWTL